MSCFVNLYNGTKGVEWEVISYNKAEDRVDSVDDALVFKPDCGKYMGKYLFYSSTEPIDGLPRKGLDDVNEPWMAFSIENESDYYSPILGHVVLRTVNNEPIKFVLSEDKTSYIGTLPTPSRNLQLIIRPKACSTSNSNKNSVEGYMNYHNQYKNDFIAGVY